MNLHFVVLVLVLRPPVLLLVSRTRDERLESILIQVCPDISAQTVVNMVNYTHVLVLFMMEFSKSNMVLCPDPVL